MLPTVTMTLRTSPSTMLDWPLSESTSTKFPNVGELGGADRLVVSSSASGFSAIAIRK